MARDTYEMTSPMRVLSYGLGVAKYIPPTVAVVGFKSLRPAKQPSSCLQDCSHNLDSKSYNGLFKCWIC